MSIAVCVFCGEIKQGAFSPCRSCKITPITEEDLAHSIAFSSRYLPVEMVQSLSDEVRRGGPWPVLEPYVLEQVRLIARNWMASPTYEIALDMASRGATSVKVRTKPPKKSMSIMATGLLVVSMIGFTALSAVQLYAGSLGIHHYVGTGWTVAIIVAVFILRFTIPLAVGTFICVTQLWDLHWAWGVLLAAPGIAFAIPSVLVAIAGRFGMSGR